MSSASSCRRRLFFRWISLCSRLDGQRGEHVGWRREGEERPSLSAGEKGRRKVGRVRQPGGGRRRCSEYRTGRKAVDDEQKGRGQVGGKALLPSFLPRLALALLPMLTQLACRGALSAFARRPLLSSLIFPLSASLRLGPAPSRRRCRGWPKRRRGERTERAIASST